MLVKVGAAVVQNPAVLWRALEHLLAVVSLPKFESRVVKVLLPLRKYLLSFTRVESGQYHSLAAGKEHV